MSQNIYVDRTLQFNIGGGGAAKVVFDTDDSATILYIRPATDDTGAIYFGDGTKDMDVRFTLGTAADYVQMDVGAKTLILAGAAKLSVGTGSFVQTYTTASGTMSTASISTITNNSGGTVVATIVALGTPATAQPPQAWNDAIATLATQCNALNTDLTNVKQVVSKIIDNGQAIGIWS